MNNSHKKIRTGTRSKNNEEKKANMDIQENVGCRMLHFHLIEKFVNELRETANDLRGFTVHKASALDENLRQIICSTAREKFEQFGPDIHIFGLNFTPDRQIGSWVNRKEDTY